GSTLLRRTGDDDAAGGWGLCFLARSLRTSAWIFIWLDPVSGGADRDDRSCRDRICEVSRRLRAKCCRRSLSNRTDRAIARIWHQSFDRTTGRDPFDCTPYIFEYARTSRRQACAEQFYFHKNCGAYGRDGDWNHLRMESELRGAGVALVEPSSERLEPAGGAT